MGIMVMLSTLWQELWEVIFHPVFTQIALLCTVISFLLTIFLLYLLDCRVYDEHGKQLPGPSHHLWGKNYLYIWQLGRLTQQYSKAVAEIFLRDVGDGDIVAFKWLTGKPNIIIAHPDMVKNVLSGHQLKFSQCDRENKLRSLFGKSLPTCELAQKCSLYRNILSPVFKSQSLKEMLTVFNSHSRRLVRHWHFKIEKANLGNPGIGYTKTYIDRDVKNLMIGIMFGAGFGYDFKETTSKIVAEDFEVLVSEYNRRVCSSTEPMAELWWAAYFFPPAHPDLATVSETRFLKALENIRYLIDVTIDERNTMSRGDDNAATATDLLQLLLYSNENLMDHQRLSSHEIRDHIISFMILGYENTAATIMWVIYELCRHFDVQDRCQQEIDHIMNVPNSTSKKSSKVSFDDLAQFNELIEVLKETLRMHPPFATISRHCNASCQIGDYLMKAGTKVHISVLGLHHHPDYWYAPEQFLPERFSPENVAETIKHPYQYIPFGAGSRNCIGQRFAQMAIITVMASMLSTYSFRVSPEDVSEIQFQEIVSYAPTSFRVCVHARDEVNHIHKESVTSSKR